jgi:hypothetical protein
MSNALGCGGADKGKETIACVQSKSLNEILTKGAEFVGSFSPVVDGKTYFNDYDKRRAAGKFIQKASAQNLTTSFGTNQLSHSLQAVTTMKLGSLRCKEVHELLKQVKNKQTLDIGTFQSCSQ